MLRTNTLQQVHLLLLANHVDQFNAICQTVVGSSKVNRKLASEPELICETEAISGQVLPPAMASIVPAEAHSRP